MSEDEYKLNTICSIPFVRENDMRTEFMPSCVGLIPATNDAWIELTVDEPQIEKQMLLEGFRYYSTSMLWLKILQLTKANSEPLTEDELRMWSICESTAFNVPEPIYLYLKGLGTIEADTGQTLIPRFPELPNQQVQGQGGYFGVVDGENHILYEEFPTLGVTGEGLRQSLSDAPPGVYNSSVAPAELAVNTNLQGFGPLGINVQENNGDNKAGTPDPDGVSRYIQSN